MKDEEKNVQKKKQVVKPIHEQKNKKRPEAEKPKVEKKPEAEKPKADKIFPFGPLKVDDLTNMFKRNVLWILLALSLLFGLVSMYNSFNNSGRITGDSKRIDDIVQVNNQLNTRLGDVETTANNNSGKVNGHDTQLLQLTSQVDTMSILVREDHAKLAVIDKRLSVTETDLTKVNTRVSKVEGRVTKLESNAEKTAFAIKALESYDLAQSKSFQAALADLELLNESQKSVDKALRELREADTTNLALTTALECDEFFPSKRVACLKEKKEKKSSTRAQVNSEKASENSSSTTVVQTTKVKVNKPVVEVTSENTVN